MQKKAKKKIPEGEQPEEIKLSTNLKRWRDRGENQSKKLRTQLNP